MPGWRPQKSRKLRLEWSAQMAQVSRWLMLAVLLTLAAAAQAQDSYYKDKTLTIIAPNAPGNTASQLAQAFADHVGAYIPGNPKTRVEFMPGGPAGLLARSASNMSGCAL